MNAGKGQQRKQGSVPKRKRRKEKKPVRDFQEWEEWVEWVEWAEWEECQACHVCTHEVMILITSADLLQQVLSDPEIQEALNDPATSQKLMSIMSNPATALQHMNDPKIARILQKLMPIFAKGATQGEHTPPEGGFPGGFPGSGPASGAEFDVD